MATDSQNLIFHMLGNKAKLDLTRELPSRLPTTVAPNGFWAQKMSKNDDPPIDRPPPPPPLPRAATQFNEDDDGEDTPPDIDDDNVISTHSRSHSRSRSRKSHRSRRSRRRRKSRSRSRSEISHRSRTQFSHTQAPEDHQEARNFYINKLREIHVSTGQPFDSTRYESMHIRDLQFIYNRNKNDQNTKSTVRFMKDVVKLGLTGIEGANEYFGPFINLKGWARHATQDMSRYDSCLEKIYKRYWRKGSVNPFMDLGLLIVGSAVVYHFQGLGNRPQNQTLPFGGPTGPSGPDFAKPPPASNTGTTYQRQSMKPPEFNTGSSGMGGMMSGLMGGGGGLPDPSMIASVLPMLNMAMAS